MPNPNLKVNLHPIYKRLKPAVSRYLFDYAVDFGKEISIPFVNGGAFSVIPDALGVAAYLADIQAVRFGSTSYIIGKTVYFRVAQQIGDINTYKIRDGVNVFDVRAAETGIVVPSVAVPALVDYDFYLNLQHRAVPIISVARSASNPNNLPSSAFIHGQWNATAATFAHFWFRDYDWATIINMMTCFTTSVSFGQGNRVLSGVDDFLALDDKFWLPSGEHFLLPSTNVSLGSPQEYYMLVVEHLGHK